MELGNEPTHIKEMYGITGTDRNKFANQCLTARRLAEAGVRFIELNAGNWDHHRNLRTTLERSCASTDQPIAALLADLAARDMLKDTLVMWGGEFGRTPRINGNAGRDHWPNVFSCFMAGGGIKGGTVIGSSDEDGMQPKDRPVPVSDLHATVCHALGIDPNKEVQTPLGRPMKLVDNGKPVAELFG